MKDDPIPWWQALTTVEVAAEVERDPVVVLPLASTEQHGPHLPLSTDLDIGLGLLASAVRHLPAGFPAWVLPAQALGASTEHASFPGTLGVDDIELIALIERQGAALARAGIRRLVLSNSHGGNRAAMDAAGLKLRRAHGLLVVKATYTRFGRPNDVDLPEEEWIHGLHGGAIETAMMLHLRPDLVRTDRIADVRSLGVELDQRLRRVGPEGVAPFSWLADDLAPGGVVGNAGLGTTAMGALLVDYYGRALAEVLQDARDFPLSRLSHETGTR